MKPKITTRAVKAIFMAPYTHSGVQKLIRWIMDEKGISQFTLSKRAELSAATIFQILNKSDKEVTRPPRRSTLSSLARTMGARVHFDSKRNRFALLQDIDWRPEKELSLVLSDIASVLVASGKKHFTQGERDRISRVVKALMT
jgi:transcriptional regulator with XRE-family HTH domain